MSLTDHRAAHLAICALRGLLGSRRAEWSSTSTRSLLGLGRSAPSYWWLAVRLLCGVSRAERAGLRMTCAYMLAAVRTLLGAPAPFPPPYPLSAPRWAERCPLGYILYLRCASTPRSNGSYELGHPIVLYACYATDKHRTHVMLLISIVPL